MSQQCLPFRSDEPDSTKKRAREQFEDAEEGTGGTGSLLQQSGGESIHMAPTQVTTGVTDIADLVNMDAMDYLAAVRKEAVTIPHVCVATKNLSISGTTNSNKGEEGKDDGMQVETTTKESPNNNTTSNNGSTTKKKCRSPPVDGSAAMLHYMLSPRTELLQATLSSQLPKSPSKWTDSILADFSSLRHYIEQCSAAGIGRKSGTSSNRIHHHDTASTFPAVPVPAMKDVSGWNEFCVGTLEAEGNTDGYFDDDDEAEEIGIEAANDVVGVDIHDGTAKPFSGEVKADDNEGDDDGQGNGEKANEMESSSQFDDAAEPKKTIPENDNEPAWRKFHLESQYESTDTTSSAEAAKCSTQEYHVLQPIEPTVPLLLQMDQVMTRRILSHMVSLLVEDEYDLTPQRTLWIYALLARLEKPLHRNEEAMLRNLLRHCCRVRSEADPPSEKDNLSSVNTIIAIVSTYFEQGRGGMSCMALAESATQPGK
jgi:hypothetical protein